MERVSADSDIDQIYLENNVEKRVIKPYLSLNTTKKTDSSLQR